MLKALLRKSLVFIGLGEIENFSTVHTRVLMSKLKVGEFRALNSCIFFLEKVEKVENLY